MTATKIEIKCKVDCKKVEASKDLNYSNTDFSAPVRKNKVEPNDKIMLDEQSSVIKQLKQRKQSDSVVYEKRHMPSTGRMKPRWTDEQTMRFYRGLGAFGTDFGLMVALFPGRTRKQIKSKFKKEEKNYLPLVNKALLKGSSWDANFEIEFAKERRLTLEKTLKKGKEEGKEIQQAYKGRIVKQCKAATFDESIHPEPIEIRQKKNFDTEIIIQEAIAKKRQKMLKLAEQPTRATLSKGPCGYTDFATLTPINRIWSKPKVGISHLHDMATLQRMKPAESPSSKAMPHDQIWRKPEVGISRLHDMATLQRIKPTESPSSKTMPHIVVLNDLPAVSAEAQPSFVIAVTLDNSNAPSQKLSTHTQIEKMVV